MTLSRLLLFGLVALLCAPTVADAQQTRRDRAEQRIRAECGDDRACAERMRDELRERQQNGQAQATDRTQRTRQQGGAASGGALPARAQAAFDALPPDVQREMLERCADDRDCLRQAMRRYRQQNGGAADAAGETALRPAPIGGGALLDSAVARPRSVPGVLPTGETAQQQTRVPAERVGAGQGAPRQAQAPSTTAQPAPPPASGQPARPNLSATPPIVTNTRPLGQLPQTGNTPVATPNPSTPTETFFAYGGTSETNLSGQGGHTVTTKEPGNGAFLIGIESEEQSDVPCGWRFLWYRDNDSDARQGYFTTRGGDCSSTVDWNDDWGTRYHENATIDRILNPTDDDVRAVKSVQVCMNRDDDRIKGVRVGGAHVDSDGRVSSDSNIDGEFERTNCHDWSTERTCPSGEVAVGIKVEFGDAHDMISGSSDNNASGMRLICADPYTETD